ncbi:hypothetical protein Q3G72_019195 [Acer saccharum]|nr:hypothetical protein Q3G72_019195 [Acer saccharum]
MPSQQPESQDLLYSDDEDNRAVVDNKDNGAAEAADTEDGPAGFGDGLVNEEGDEELTEKDTERAKSQRKNKGKYIAEEAEADKGDELVKSDYDQEAKDIAIETCVDPTNNWESLQLLDLPHGSGSGSDKDDGSEDLGSLDGSNGEEDAEGPVRKFIKRRYHEFNPTHDLQDPVFRLGLEFSSADMFRKAIRAHSMKYRRYYRVRSAAREMIQGSVKEQYSKLWEYDVEIQRMNPNSSVIMRCSTAAGGAKPRLQRLYMCLGALK